MKKFRWLSLVVLLGAVIYFASYSWNTLRTKDNLGPVIEMDESQIYLSVKDDEEALLKGVTAMDSKDGDVTESLVVESVSAFVDHNERYISYAAFDSDNHVSKASRKLIYTDYEPVRFSLEAPLRFVASASRTQDILGNVEALDCLDGNISDRIKFSPDSSVDVYSEGEYSVTLEVTNSAGDTAELPVTITIYDMADENASPKIELSEYLVYTKVGQTLNPMDYIEGVTYRSADYELSDGRGTFGVDTSEMSGEELAAFRQESPSVARDRFEIIDQADYQTPGVYEIQYSLEDNDENIGRVRLVVVVEEE